MTKTELELKKLKQDAEIAAADRAQRESDSTKSAAANVAGSLIKATGGKFFRKNSKGGKSRGRDNDPAWYKKLVGITQPNTMVPDFQVLGRNDKFIRVTGPNVPQLVVFNYAPVIGDTILEFYATKPNIQGVGQDAMNRALNRIATQLENRNSRVASYSRDTIGRYFFITTDVVQDILRLKVAIDCFTMADSSKPFISAKIIRGLGFNYHDFKSNIASYKSFYCSIAEEFNNSLPIPSDLAYLQRKVFLSTTIIRDSGSEYDTLMLFNKCIQYFFQSENAEISPDDYVSDQIPTYGLIFEEYTVSIRSRINTLVTGATWRPFIRDLRGSTKSATWYKLPVDVDTTVVSITDSREVRNQLHNMTVYPWALAANMTTEDTSYGLLVKSFSVGGDNIEAIRQGLRYGVGEKAFGIGTSVPAELLNTPGLFIHLGGTTSEANNWRAQFGSSSQTGTAYSGYKVYNQYDAYTPDSLLVGTRLCALYDMIFFNYGNTDQGFTMQLDGRKSLTVQAGQLVSGTMVRPVIYGTELVMNIQVINQFPITSVVDLQEYIVPANGLYMKISTQGDPAMDNVVDYKFTTTNCAGVNSSVGLQSAKDKEFVISLLSAVDWAPIIDFVNFVKIGQGPHTTAGHTVVGELDHYVDLDATVLYRLHAQAIESMAYLPEVVYLKPLQ